MRLYHTSDRVIKEPDVYRGRRNADFGPAYTQVALKTEKAASQLSWIGAENITGIDEALHRQEQEAYQASLAEAMVRRT